MPSITRVAKNSLACLPGIVLMISSYGPATAGSYASLDGLLPAFDGNTKPPAAGFVPPIVQDCTCCSRRRKRLLDPSRTAMLCPGSRCDQHIRRYILNVDGGFASAGYLPGLRQSADGH